MIVVIAILRDIGDSYRWFDVAMDAAIVVAALGLLGRYVFSGRTG